jgi:DnaJ-class molecular chaperone
MKAAMSVVCSSCLGRGQRREVTCARCGGLGWVWSTSEIGEMDTSVAEPDASPVKEERDGQ